MNKMQHHQIGLEIDNLFNPSSYVRLSDPLPVYNATPFTPDHYTPPQNVVNQHEVTRFGHTNNFEALAKGLANSSDSASDYIVGVCAAAMLIFAIALVWFMVIIGLKIAGQKKVGFLAGRLVHPDYDGSNASEVRDGGTLPIIEEEPTGLSEDLEIESPSDIASPLIISNTIDLEAVKRDKKFERKVIAVRATFIIAGLCVLVCSALFYAKGVAMFRNSLNSTSHGLKLIQDTAYEAIDLTDTVGKDKDMLIDGFDNITSSVTGQFCEGNEAIAQQINGYVDEFKKQASEMNKEIQENVMLFQNDLQEVIKITEDVDNSLNDVNIFFYITVSISIIIGLLIMGMMVVTAFSAKGISNCCTKFSTYAIIWPVFTFFLILFWIFALVFLVTSLSGSDFCVKPDQVVEGALEHYKDRFHSVIFTFLIYYVSGCKVRPDGEGSQMAEITNSVTGALNTAHDLSEKLMTQPLGSLESQCGLTNAAATAVKEGAVVLHNATHALNGAWIGIQGLLECRTFNPIYTTFVHNAICVDGVGGLTWLFTSSFFLVMFAMIMLMFRAALYPAKRPAARAGFPASTRTNSGLSASLMGKST